MDSISRRRLSGSHCLLDRSSSRGSRQKKWSAASDDAVSKRPLSVTIIGWLFIAAGTVGLLYHARELKMGSPFDNDAVWVCVVRLLAIIGGVFVLRSHNWARWLLLLWMVYHVVLSAYHSLSQVITHALLLALIAYFLLRRQASAYFRSARIESATIAKTEG